MAMKKVREQELDTLELEVPKEELPRVSLEGCEIVRRQFLSHLKENILTIRPDGIQFNNACITRMPDVRYIYLIIDRSKRWFIISACDEDDKDGQRWCTVKNDERKSRKIQGKPFCDRIYSMMGWNKGYGYKICGTFALQVEDEDKLLMVFELDEAEAHAMSSKARAYAGVEDVEVGAEELAKLDELEKKRQADREQRVAAKAAGEKIIRRYRKRAVLPQQWGPETFGVPFEEHKAKAEVPHLPARGDSGDLFIASDNRGW
jgi:hypothetical protein